MSSIRTSDSSNLSLIQSLIASNRAQYNALSQQISSGNKYLKRSDDAAETNKAALVDNDETQNTQFKSNVSTVTNWETATYSYLTDISTQFKSAVTVCTEANSTINEPSGWGSLATELDNVIDSLMADGNANYLGTSIFAGTQTSSTTDTFTSAQQADPTYTGFTHEVITYNGSTTDYRSVQTSKTTSADYGTLGSDVFQGVKITTSDGTSKTFDSLQTLVDLRDYLNAKGELSGDQLSYYKDTYGIGTEDLGSSEIFSRMMNIVEAGSTQVSQCLSDNSASSNRFDSLTDTIANTVSVDETQYSNIVKVDTVKAATDLANVQTVLTASMTLAGNISKMSLVNYI